MKELLYQYAGYNIWANNIMIDAMLKLSDAKVDKTINSSYQSIRATTLHCWSAEDIWLQRLMLQENTLWAESIFRGSFEDACLNWQIVSRGLEHFVGEQTDESLHNTLTYKDMQGVQHSLPVFQVLNHVFNHANYHRGQLITMLRQVGETVIPRTDYIVYARR